MKVDALWQSCLYYAFAVEGNHTLNLNGYSITVEVDFQHARAEYVLFWVNQNDSGDEVVFTVENEPGKNDAPRPHNPEGKILLNTTNPEHLYKEPENDKPFDLNVRTSIFTAGLFGVPGKVVINSGYYESGTSRNDHQTYGSIVSLYENAELVVNGGQLVGRGDFYECGTVRVGYRSKAVFNGGEIWGIGGAYAVVPVIYDGFVRDFRDTLDDSLETFELFDYENDCPNSVSSPQWTCWVKGYSCHKGSEEVVVNGGSFCFQKKFGKLVLVYTYTFPATGETAGVTISGKVTSFGTGTTTVKLLDENGNDAGFTPCTGTETEFTYTFTNVPAGDYIIRVMKANHVTRDYKVSVE